MDFMMISSLRNYTQNLKLENKWKKRKAQNDFTPDESMTEIQRQNERFKYTYKLQQEQQEKDETLSSILNKVNSGAELSDTEMHYLKVKSPQVYQSVKRLEMEEKAYERELERCETKEEVEKLKFSKINGALSQINAVKNNPNIPDGKKLEVILEVQKTMDMVEKCHVKFAESGKLDALPTDAEKKKAEEEIKESEQNQVKETLETENTQQEITKQPENTFAEDKAVQTLPNEETSEQNLQTDSPEEEETPTIFEAEHSPEAEKLRRSRAKTAYLKAMDEKSDENY